MCVAFMLSLQKDERHVYTRIHTNNARSNALLTFTINHTFRPEQAYAYIHKCTLMMAMYQYSLRPIRLPSDI